MLGISAFVKSWNDKINCSAIRVTIPCRHVHCEFSIDVTATWLWLIRTTFQSKHLLIVTAKIFTSGGNGMWSDYPYIIIRTFYAKPQKNCNRRLDYVGIHPNKNLTSSQAYRPWKHVPFTCRIFQHFKDVCSFQKKFSVYYFPRSIFKAIGSNSWGHKKVSFSQISWCDARHTCMIPMLFSL